MKPYTKTKLVALATLCLFGAILGTRPLIPLLSSGFGASALEIGIIISLFSLLPLFLAVKMGHWVDRFGALPHLVISSIVGAAALTLPFLFGNLTGVYLSQIFSGIAQTLFAVAAQSFVGRQSSSFEREKHVALFSLGVSAGGLIGPFTGGIFSDWLGFATPILCFSFLAFIASIILLTLYFHDRKNERAEENSENKRSKQTKTGKTIDLLTIPNLRRSILLSILVLLARDLYLSYFPLLGDSFGYSATTIGIIIGLHNGAALLIRLVMQQIIHRWGKSEVVVTSIVISGLLYAFIPIFSHIAFSIFISVLLGFGLGLGQPLSISSTVAFSPERRVGEVLGLRLTFNRLTQFASPIILGGVASVFHLGAIFWVVAGCLFIGSPKTFIKEESKKFQTKKSGQHSS